MILFKDDFSTLSRQKYRFWQVQIGFGRMVTSGISVIGYDVKQIGLKGEASYGEITYKL